MNIKQLISFVTVASRRSLSQAAMILNYSQSTIYEHLNSLEDELKAKLYSRTSQGIELSNKGRQFIPYAMQIIDLYNESLNKISELNKEYIRIGASASNDVCIMEHLISEFVNIYPQVEIEYSVMTTDVALSKTMVGNCDIAFVCELDLETSDVNARYLCTLPCVFVTAPNKVENEGLVIDGGKLPTMLGTMQLEAAFKMLESVGLEFYKCFSSLMNIGDLPLVKHFTILNKGISLLPKTFVQKDIEKGLLARIPNMLQEVKLKIFVLTSNKKNLRPSVANIMNLAFKLYGK